MIKRSEAQWRELFDEQTRSGLSAVAFCREKKLCASYYSLRRRQLLGTEAKPKESAFVAAQVLPLCSGIEVQVGVVRLRLPESISAGYLSGRSGARAERLSHADVRGGAGGVFASGAGGFSQVDQRTGGDLWRRRWA